MAAIPLRNADVVASRRGRVAAGADANLVVLDSDGGITDVMAMGWWHVRDGRQAVRGRFEEAGR